MDYSLIPQSEAVELSKKRLKENIKKPWGLFGVDTGHHDLNLLIGGWIPGKVTTIAARSGIGKTAYTTQFWSRGAQVVNGKRAQFLFMTWEMTSSYLVDRHICYNLGITNRLLTQGAKLLGPQTLKRIADTYKEASNLPITYQEMSIDGKVASAIIREFVDTCKKLEEAEKVQIQPVIVIDYIGMAQFEGFGPRTYSIGDYMNMLKQVANTTGASICVFAQIARRADSKPIPERADLSDSKSIEDASDNLILLHRPEYSFETEILDPASGIKVDAKNKLLIRVLKGRDFGLGDKLINCDIKYYRFWDQSQDKWNTPYWEWYDDESYWKQQFGFEKLGPDGQVEILNDVV